MKKLLIVMVLGASAVAASAQGLRRPGRTLGSRLVRPRQPVSQATDVIGAAGGLNAGDIAPQCRSCTQTDGRGSVTNDARVKNKVLTIPRTIKDLHEVRELAKGPFVGLMPRRHGEMTDYDYESVEVEEGNEKYSAYDGVIYDVQGKTVLFCPAARKGTVQIRDGAEIICESAFYDCTNLTEVVVPPSVCKIEREAFMCCPRLKVVRLSEGLCEIGWDAFRGCMCLTDLTIPYSVSEIGSGAFDGCEALLGRAKRCDGYFVLDGWAMMSHGCTANSLVLPADVRGVAAEAFTRKASLREEPAGCLDQGRGQLRGLSYWIKRRGLPDSVTNEVWVAPQFKSVVFPEGLRHIGSYAFGGTKIGTLDLPDGVVTIGQSAFCGCTNLTSALIPASVRRCESLAFSGCRRLTKIDMAEGLTKLPWHCFADCRSLTEVMIPSSVTNGLVYAFDGCAALQSIDVAEGNPVYCSRDGIVYTKDGKELVICPPGKTSVTVPQGVTTIRYSAFGGCSKLAEVFLPSSVTNIGGCAFERCSTLKSICIPDGVRELGPRTFAECLSLEDVRLPKNLVKLGGPYQWGHLGGCFQECTNLRSIDIPRPCRKIWFHTFSGSGLQSIVLPEGIEEVPSAVFSDCTNLVSVKMPASVKNIRSDAFRGCRSLREIDIPCGVTNIGDRAFESCGRLSEIKIPDSVKRVGSWAFEHCTNVTSVTMPTCVEKLEMCFPNAKDSLTNIILTGKMTSIGKSFFENCRGLKTVTIPSCVTNIGKGAFRDCSGLKSVTIPASVTRIGDRAFAGCSGLTTMEVPSNVTDIGESAFQGCSGLTSVTIPSSVTDIGYAAFCDCSGLTSVTIPSGVTNVAEAAFSGCSGVTSFSVDGSNPSYCSRAGMLCSKDGMVLLAGVNGDVAIPSGVTRVEKSAFSRYGGLTSVTIPQSVTNIGECAFRDCRALMSFSVASDNPVYSAINGLLCSKDGKRLIAGVNGDVVIPSDVTCIEEEAFAGCRGLTSVTIPSSVESIGRLAFLNCSGMTSVTIPTNVTSIGHAPFLGCSGLTSVTIPSNLVKRILSDFSKCNNLKTVKVVKDGTVETMSFDGLKEHLRQERSPRTFGLRVPRLQTKSPMNKSLSRPEAQTNESCSATNDVRMARPGLLGGSLRARRLQRRQEQQAAAAKQQAVQEARETECKVQAEQKKDQREAERAEQRRLNEELKKVREQKAATTAGKEDIATASRTSNTSASVVNVVAEKLGQCDFLLNKDFKKNAKVYLCLFSASWCPPCRREMPRIAETYAETLKDDPDIELIHFSRDRDDREAMDWAKEHDVRFPVVAPDGGNPLDLHSRGIPHLFIIKANGVLLEEGHPMRIFNVEKFRELKEGK